MKTEGLGLKVTGVVQGVGFRPFVYKLATSLLLKGRVLNTGDGVRIEIEGDEDSLRSFLERLKNEAPPLSFIRRMDVEKVPCKGYDSFSIESSKSENTRNTIISPDISICEDCRKEFFNAANRRYLYPFINCTNCGPRFTIIRDIPYDRANTTMDAFHMCEDCRNEYENPLDRRYHAEPVSCEKCGPKITLLKKGPESATADSCVHGGQTDENTAGSSFDELVEAGRLLSAGCILAIKGLGGYHLACDASNRQAVIELRKRKHRDEKPFALMARDALTVMKYCTVSDKEKDLLESFRKPVVILGRKPGCPLPEELAPGNPTLGIMLPYTPLHVLLFEHCPELLVMTSGNISNEPICYGDSEALRKLGGIADVFLTNNRDIFVRTDDSVTRIFKNREYIVRRSRGYAPMPVITEIPEIRPDVPSVLACGGELKNTFCISKGMELYMSHHIGDLENMATLQSFEEGVRHYEELFGVKPGIVAYDLHPGYLSTKHALARPVKRKIAVQHHKAHIASCMADNNIGGDVIGVAFDGTGYGEDGNIWGGEFFTGSLTTFKRAAHLRYVRLPSSEAAVREPWRMGLSYLYSAGLDIGAFNLSGVNRPKYELDVIIKMLQTGFNSPHVSSMGRLFDAVAAIAGVKAVSAFEGQAAMELEFQASAGACGAYEYGIEKTDGVYVIDTAGIITGVFGDFRRNVGKDVISSRFHETVALIVLETCSRLRNETGYGNVVLSGGVFQNMLLLGKCITKLEKGGFKVFIHSRIPANDAGISAGQALVAMAHWPVF